MTTATMNGKATVLGDRQQKPPTATVDPSQVHDGLKMFDRWTGWKWEWNAKKNKWDKPPINCKTGRYGSSTNPEHWYSFEEVHEAQRSEKVDGIGFILGEADGGVHFAGIDLDDCRNPSNGELTELAQDVIDTMDTYTEVSPSGTGVKVFCIGGLPNGIGTKNKDGTVEIYSRGRYFTVTGQHIEGTPRRVEQRQERLESIHDKLIGREKKPKPTFDPQPDRADAETNQAALDAMLRLKVKPDENDGSKRLLFCGKIAVEHGLTDLVAIATWRVYSTIRRFPADWSDDDFLRRVRDAEKTTKRGSKDNPFRRRAIEKFTLTELVDSYPTLNPPVIDGLFREGETVNIFSTSKIGKSWLAYGLAISIIKGRDWLDSYKCAPGKVLLIDNELHRPTLANRVPKVGWAMDCYPEEYADQLEVWPLRGNLRSLEELRAESDKIEPGEFKVIILDAKYRFQKPGTSENDNAEETQIYNLIDNYADKLGACFVLIHHGSKGSQSEKRVTDVGAGAGAQSRAADCHLVLREHEEKDVVVLDAAVRSFAPVESLALRWQFPLWVPDEYADTTKLKGNKSRQEQKQADRDKEGIDLIIAALKEGRATCKELIGRTGIGHDRLKRLLGRLLFDEQILTNETTRRGNSCDEYGLAKSDL